MMQVFVLLGLMGAPDGALALLERFECGRCHALEEVRPVSDDKHCVRCHENILQGKMDVSRDTLTRWQDHVKSLTAAPSLRAADRRLRAEWIQTFLLAPRDMRPDLPASMPRLRISPSEAKVLAEHLASAGSARRFVPDPEQVKPGRSAFAARGCGGCHAFGGVTPAPPLAAHPIASARSLAPDLRFTRARMEPTRVVDWILDPGPLMPRTVTSRAEAEAIAAFLLLTPVQAPATLPTPERLPPLDRKVTFEEVSTKVFRVVCWHCHSSEDFAFGDGGPGNTGGFGFDARGVDLSSYAATARGYLDAEGRRHSLFRPASRPRLLEVLLARQREVKGDLSSARRGMPLGFPPLTPAQIQLVESWIAQGRPR